MIYIIYDQVGRILRNISSPQDMIEVQLQEGEMYLESDNLIDDSVFYIDNSTIVKRPSFSETVQGTTISSLPIPTTIIVQGVSYEVSDGVAELSFNLPGTYPVILQSFPYQTKTIEVTQE